MVPLQLPPPFLRQFPPERVRFRGPAGWRQATLSMCVLGALAIPPPQSLGVESVRNDQGDCSIERSLDGSNGLLPVCPDGYTGAGADVECRRSYRLVKATINPSTYWSSVCVWGGGALAGGGISVGLHRAPIAPRIFPMPGGNPQRVHGLSWMGGHGLRTASTKTPGPL
jgi:hypothetical protein